MRFKHRDLIVLVLCAVLGSALGKPGSTLWATHLYLDQTWGEGIIYIVSLLIYNKNPLVMCSVSDFFFVGFS